MNEIAKYEDRIGDIEQAVSAMTVRNNGELEQAAAFIKGVWVLQAEISGTFDPIIQKAHAAHKEAIAQRDRYMKPLDSAVKKLRGDMAGYAAEQERIRQAEERRIRDEQRRLEDEARKAADKAAALREKGQEKRADNAYAKAEQASLQAAALDNVKVESGAKASGVTFRKDWDIRVVNANDVPREFLAVDEKAIRALVKARKGNVTIPGVEVIEKQIPVTR